MKSYVEAGPENERRKENLVIDSERDECLPRIYAYLFFIKVSILETWFCRVRPTNILAKACLLESVYHPTLERRRCLTINVLANVVPSR